MVDYGKYQIGLNLEKANFLATIYGICQIVGVLTILPISDYLGRKKTIIISNSLITVSLIGILFTRDYADILFILIGIMAIFYGATFPVYGACSGDYFSQGVNGNHYRGMDGFLWPWGNPCALGYRNFKR